MKDVSYSRAEAVSPSWRRRPGPGIEVSTMHDVESADLPLGIFVMPFLKGLR